LIRAWCLAAAAYAARMMSGGGAYRRGGRWNSQGRALVYMSESLSLCVLENLVHMVKVPMLQGFKSIWVDIPEKFIHTIEKKTCPLHGKQCRLCRKPNRSEMDGLTKKCLLP
jgi:RES domain-containing protein